MVAVTPELEGVSALAGLTSAVDALLGMSLTSLPTRELPELARKVETQLRRLPVFDQAVIAEMDRRDVAAELGARDTATVLVQTLRITPGEAKARVQAAADLGPRLGLGGEPLPPLFPDVAAAQAAGAISAQHAKVVVTAIDRLPHAIQADHSGSVELALVDGARDFDPTIVAGLARHIRDHLDPDGTLTSEHDRHRRRDVALFVRPDGSGHLGGRLTAACTAAWQAVLDAVAAPRPANDGERDPRTPGQRAHDAFHDVATKILTAGDVPDAGGTPATVIVTMTLDQLETRTGLASTAHGGSISIAQALQLADQADVVPTVVNDAGGVLAHGRTRRVASPRQRVVLAGRDRGCSFPGCDAPPAWTQAHHVRSWAAGGRTDIDNLTLVCGFHHREHERHGWECRITDGVPEWSPPAWIDVGRTPRRNTAHHLERLLAAPPRASTPC